MSRVRGHNCNVFTIPALRRFSHSILYPFKDNPLDIGTSFLGIDSRIGGKNSRKKKDRQRELHAINDPDLKRELASGQTQLISYTES
ncbi:MAG: hypothetical protein ACRD93_04705 [Nitrososphaeraceae archaeon]|jgi:hypothetical protein